MLRLIPKASASSPFNPFLSRNVFVEIALTYALSYVSTHSAPSLKPAIITILADSDYYSQAERSTQVKSGSAQHDTFVDFQAPLRDIHKTGLGSSAALVTALIAAVLSYYLPDQTFHLSSEAGKLKLHNLAQAAHCAAQGKIGSGFDVAAAVYGACLYRRFSPSVLEELGKPGTHGFAKDLASLVEDGTGSSKWDTVISKNAVKLPKKLRLVLCDVDCGTETVGMAKKVLAWRQENPKDADNIWSQLQNENDELASILAILAKMQASKAEEYERGIEILTCEQKPSGDDHIWEGYYVKLRSTFGAIRSLIRQMSDRAGVPIEPQSQTKLLNACSALRGVIGGVVPGAGGYDAIALLVVDDSMVLNRLNALLESRTLPTAEYSGTTVGKVRMMGVREDMQGVRMETDEKYGDWLRQQ